MNYRTFLFYIIVLVSLIGCKSTKDLNTVFSDFAKNENDSQVLTGSAGAIRNANWQISRVSNGIVYGYFQFDSLFNSKQSVNVFDVDLNKKIKIEIPHLTDGFIKTSEAGVRYNADAAINGSYFNTKIGGSVVFFKLDGEIIKESNNKFVHYRENAGFATDKSGSISILRCPKQGWSAVTESTVLSSGPLLIHNGKIVEQEDVKFNTNRHPRTAIGITENNHLIAVVVDGRDSEAHGMSIDELSILMQSLGCTDAMNLDGGGSSTAWIKDRGVVNYPSDNKKFDHEGERGVANVITFTSR